MGENCIVGIKQRETESDKCLTALRELTDSVHNARSVVQDRLKLFVHNEYEAMPQAAAPLLICDVTAPYFIEMARYIQEIKNSIEDIISRVKSSEL